MWFTKPSDREQEHKRIVLQNLGPLADTPEMASDLWELARLRDMWRS
jgi:hypothetical protein